jgi:hypothetical protein
MLDANAVLSSGVKCRPARRHMTSACMYFVNIAARTRPT